MIRHVALGAALATLVSLGAAVGLYPVTVGATQTAPGPTTPAQGGMAGMMKMHEQMMADMKAADARLDALAGEMNTATGDARITAIAAVVTELVRQQKAMHARMGLMHEQMMGGGGGMMMGR
jgi:hypothetical protein